MSTGKLATRVATAVAAVCALAFVLVAVFALMTFSRAERHSAEEAAKGQVSAVVDLLELTAQTHAAGGMKRLGVLKNMLGDALKSASATGDKDAFGMPVFRVAGEVVNGNEKLLLRWKEILIAEPALLMLNDKGDMVRVATLLKDKEGKSMVGKPIPASAPETQTVMRGEEWAGVVQRSGKFYVSAFLPLKDTQGKVIGAWSVRTDVSEDMARLSDTLKKMKFGDTGYPYAIKIEKDLADSFFTLHPKLEGKNTREVKGPLLMLATEMSAKDEGTISYMYDDENGKSREKIVVFKKTPSWGWTVAGGTWIDEYNKNAASIRLQMIFACVLGALVSAFAAWYAANRGLVRPGGVLPWWRMRCARWPNGRPSSPCRLPKPSR